MQLLLFDLASAFKKTEMLYYNIKDLDPNRKVLKCRCG